MDLSFDLIKGDIIAAKQAIDYYRNHKISSIKNVAAFHLQQATEKLIKIQIYQNSDNINHSQFYTHNIERLLFYAEQNNIPVIVPDIVVEQSNIITNWATESRYMIDFKVKINELDSFFEVLKQWFKDVKKDMKN